MTIFDQFIRDIENLLPNDFKVFSHEKSTLEKGSKNDVLFSKDTAFELGGSQKSCVSTLAVSSEISFDNSTYLYGQDLCDIKGDCNFGKIVFIEIEDISEDDAFDKIKELELVRYNFCPKGFMSRASALSMREQLRVSKAAIKQGLSFKNLGDALIDEYLKFPQVKSVRIIFITDSFNEFQNLYALSDKIKTTLSALNKILDNILFDCSSCNLKEICDEVDGMKELHMAKSKNK